jgi:hypothetical protein
VYRVDQGTDRVELLADSGGFSPDVTLDTASIGDDAVYRLVDADVEVVLSGPEGLAVCDPTNFAFGGPETGTI